MKLNNYEITKKIDTQMESLGFHDATYVAEGRILEAAMAALSKGGDSFNCGPLMAKVKVFPDDDSEIIRDSWVMSYNPTKCGDEFIDAYCGTVTTILCALAETSGSVQFYIGSLLKIRVVAREIYEGDYEHEVHIGPGRQLSKLAKSHQPA